MPHDKEIEWEVREMEILHETSPCLFSPLTQTPTRSLFSLSPSLFIATKLAAAEQHVQLSESSSDSALWKASLSFLPSFSSPWSVNMRPAPATMVVVANDEDKIGGASQQRRPCYCLIDHLYVATAWDRWWRQPRQQPWESGFVGFGFMVF